MVTEDMVTKDFGTVDMATGDMVTGVTGRILNQEKIEFFNKYIFNK